MGTDQATKILKNNDLTRNTIDSLLNRGIKFRKSRYVDEKLTLFKSKYAPVNKSNPTNNNNNTTTISYGHQQQGSTKIAEEELVDEYGFEKPSTYLFPKDKIIPSWKTIQSIGAGLTDIGDRNSALNTVLQAITYTPMMNHYLLSKWHSANCTVQEYCFVCALEDHVKLVLSQHNQKVAPRQFVGKLKKMKTGSSKDAYDVWNFFMEQIQHFLLLEKGSQDKRIQETTALYQIYYGYLQDKIECQSCHNIEYQYNGFYDLPLDCQQANSIERCLTRYLNNGVEKSWDDCKNCNDTTKVRVYKSIYQLPKVLTLHVNLFDKNGNKNKKSIKYDETIDFSRYITTTLKHKSENAKYQLCGMIVHQNGSTIHSGHFVIYVKSSNGMWYCLDNELVQQVNIKRLMSQQPYMLFYTQPPKYIKPIKQEQNDNNPSIPEPIHNEIETMNDTLNQEDDNIDNDIQMKEKEDEVDEEKEKEKEIINAAKKKKKVENKSAVIVNYNDAMDDKRQKLDTLIEREMSEGKSLQAKAQLLNKTNQSQFNTSIEGWDDDDNNTEEKEDLGINIGKNNKEDQGRKAILQKLKSKRKKVDNYDLDYDRGKVKKIKNKQTDKFGKPNLFQAMADVSLLEKKNKQRKQQ
ncbi:hypothetical protein BJ944DRAFT_65977 [Cunninghamella echinulata]|nr:hypothetical protein BJ944DRAFT_65977 [Cunninghamella echinulata]